MASAFGAIQEPSKTRKRIPAHGSPDTVTSPLEQDLPELVLPAAAARRIGIHSNNARTCSFLCAIVSLTLMSLAIASLALAPLANTLNVSVADLPWGVLFAGFLAQIVDGSLGMGYG